MIATPPANMWVLWEFSRYTDEDGDPVTEHRAEPVGAIVPVGNGCPIPVSALGVVSLHRVRDGVIAAFIVDTDINMEKICNHLLREKFERCTDDCSDIDAEYIYPVECDTIGTKFVTYHGKQCPVWLEK